MKRQKIDILIVDFNGSSPTYTYYFTKAIKEQHPNVKVLGHKNEEDLIIYPVELNFIGISTSIKLLNYVLNWIYLLLWAKKFKAIHIQWLQLLRHSSFELELIKILKKRNKNLYFTIHNFYPHDEKREKVKERYDKLYAILDNLVVHTSDTFHLLKGKHISKSIIKINHGLFYSGFGENTKKPKNKMVMIGMIKEYKGFEEALYILKDMVLEGYNGILHIEGSANPEYFLKLEELVMDLCIQDHVILKNRYVPVKDLIDIYNEALVTLMPYKRIEQSGVLFTSLGLNVPVVCYDVGGVSEIVKDKVHGRIIEKGNRKEFMNSIFWTMDNLELLQDNFQNNEYRNLWRDTAKTMIKYYNR